MVCALNRLLHLLIIPELFQHIGDKRNPLEAFNPSPVC